jgi:dynein heavy chain
VAFINKWVENGIPTVFWISGFFFPQAFLTGTLQNYARRDSKPIDTISFGFRVLDRRPDTITERPRDGIYVHGLHLQGARWDPLRQSLVESRPKELFTQFPVIWFVPEEDRKIPDRGVYKCPVYKTLTRAGTLSTTGHSTNFVTSIEIPSNEAQSRWVKAGVALFCALRY